MRRAPGTVGWEGEGNQLLASGRWAQHGCQLVKGSPTHTGSAGVLRALQSNPTKPMPNLVNPPKASCTAPDWPVNQGVVTNSGVSFCKVRKIIYKHVDTAVTALSRAWGDPDKGRVTILLQQHHSKNAAPAVEPGAWDVPET